jgi:hypothetical protein
MTNTVTMNNNDNNVSNENRKKRKLVASVFFNKLKNKFLSL